MQGAGIAAAGAAGWAGPDATRLETNEIQPRTKWPKTSERSILSYPFHLNQSHLHMKRNRSPCTAVEPPPFLPVSCVSAPCLTAERTMDSAHRLHPRLHRPPALHRSLHRSLHTPRSKKKRIRIDDPTSRRSLLGAQVQGPSQLRGALGLHRIGLTE